MSKVAAPTELAAARPGPWTVNAGGSGRFFDTAEAATAAVQDLRAKGVQSIDIGCFQINLLHHPAAFANLASGFDPLINAVVAARFLRSLHEELGAWEPAIAAYHSRAATLGGPYRDRVLASWSGAPPVIRATFFGTRTWGIPVLGHYALGHYAFGNHALGHHDLGIHALGIHELGIHVWGPTGEVGAGTSPALQNHSRLAGLRLPRVITATGR